MAAGLYRGTLPNIARNCIINVGETVVYDAVKCELLAGGRMRDGVPCHFASAVVAGVTATFVASPVDVIKTRWVLYFDVEYLFYSMPTNEKSVRTPCLLIFIFFKRNPLLRK